MTWTMGMELYAAKRLINKQRADIEQLKAGMREYACTGTDHPCGCYDQFLSERAKIKQLRAEVKRLKADFLEYGNHKPDCRGGDGSSQCKCGYINIWATLEHKP